MKEAMKLALEALESCTYTSSYEKSFDLNKVDDALEALEEALAKQEQGEPVKLRRGDILRCIETDELCVVWATSTSGKTLIKWNVNSFGDYTAEQIGELFWLEPESNDVEIAAEQADNYAAFHAGVRFERAHSFSMKQEQGKPVAEVATTNERQAIITWRGKPLPHGSVLYTTPQPKPAVPDGWKLVPIEPTQEMIDAVVTSTDELLLGRDAERQYVEDWKAMLAAAPQGSDK